jgi:hypothetical protein
MAGPLPYNDPAARLVRRHGDPERFQGFLLRPVHRPSLFVVLSLALVALLAAPGAALAVVPIPRTLQPAASNEAIPSYQLYLPSNAAARSASGGLRVLVTIHGMGGDGTTSATPLLGQADRNGWIVLAPTFSWGDWRDPEAVKRDGTTFLPQLKTLIESLPGRTGLQIRPRALMYGFSRGCQAAHRFASFYPESTLAVASLSCGTYTLPYTVMPDGRDLSPAFPFGLADLERYTGRSLDVPALRRVGFLVGVGARDDQAADLPRQWDPYIGTTRLERAWSYHWALSDLGVRSQMAVFPDATHAETEQMRIAAMAFLRHEELRQYN